MTDSMTRGGEGTHWEGCSSVHWDCRIAELEALLQRWLTMHPSGKTVYGKRHRQIVAEGA